MKIRWHGFARHVYQRSPGSHLVNCQCTRCERDGIANTSARLYMQRLICLFRSVCKLISQWICSQNQPICQPVLLSNAIRHRLKSQCFCMCIVRFFLRITLMSGLLLLVTGWALLMSPKGQNTSRDGLV